MTYQLGTTLFMVENVMDEASDAVKAHSNVRGVQLDSEHQVADQPAGRFPAARRRGPGHRVDDQGRGAGQSRPV